MSASMVSCSFSLPTNAGYRDDRFRRLNHPHKTALVRHFLSLAELWQSRLMTPEDFVDVLRLAVVESTTKGNCSSFASQVAGPLGQTPCDGANGSTPWAATIKIWWPRLFDQWPFRRPLESAACWTDPERLTMKADRSGSFTYPLTAPKPGSMIPVNANYTPNSGVKAHRPRRGVRSPHAPDGIRTMEIGHGAKEVRPARGSCEPSSLVRAMLVECRPTTMCPLTTACAWSPTSTPDN